MRRKEEVKDLLRTAIQTSRKKAAERRNRTTQKIFLSAFSISIIFTMLPIEALNIVASMGSVVFMVCLFVISKNQLKNRLIWALVAGSLLSGCAGPMFSKVDPQVFELCADVTGNACKVETIQGYYIFGLPFGNITAEAAAKRGGIKRVVGVDRVRGFGLIGLAKVTVLGS